MDLGLRDRVAIVTGASRGIGRRIAVDLAGEGCDLVVCARGPLDSTVAEIEATGRPAEGVRGDVTDPPATDAIVARAIDRFGRIDIVVNNAGGNVPVPLGKTTDADWREGLELNFLAAVRLTLGCMPAMQARGWGRVISIASTYGRQPDPYFGPYSAAKAALINFTANISRAFAAEGILANCVIPGVTRTELVEANAASAAQATGRDVEQIMAKVMAKDPIATGRFGEPEEVAAAVVFLASERASWITGSCITVDGGTIRVVP
ncbi:MAG: SDR family NAD(P)-dependent oxidoreductase [Acidimicrobiales bacterium]